MGWVGKAYKLTRNDKKWQKMTKKDKVENWHVRMIIFLLSSSNTLLGYVKWNESTKLTGLATCRSWQKMTKWTNWQTMTMSRRAWDESGVLFFDIIWVKRDISSLWMIAYRYCTGFRWKVGLPFKIAYRRRRKHSRYTH